MKNRLILIALTVGAMLLAFSACNRPSPDKVAAPVPVRMAYLQNDIHHLALWVALEKGFFQEEDVEVEIAGIFRAGPEVMSAFVAGALDMAYVGEAPTTFAAANGTADVKVVAQVNTEGSALVVSTGSEAVRRVSDLKGKTIGVPGHATVQDFLVKKALVKAGIDPSNVNILIIKPPEMISALRTGQIDAFIAWEPYPAKAFELGVGRNLATSNDIWADHPCCVLVTDSTYLKSDPEKVKKVLRAHVRATEYIGDHPEEAVLIGVKYTGMDEASVRRALQSVAYTFVPSVEGEMEYVRFLSDLGYITVDDPEAFVSNLIVGELVDKIGAR
jgi:NitT/TauT family transport system substrate-binding protein